MKQLSCFRTYLEIKLNLLKIKTLYYNIIFRWLINLNFKLIIVLIYE